MASFYEHITDKLRSFIEEQKIFFVATAPVEGRINLSPKGMDSVRVVDAKTIYWLNLTGSGNESAAHVIENQRMTLMFCSFEGKPLILRIYGTATVIGKNDARWPEVSSKFPDMPGSRQVFILNVESVQTSCGFAVPLYEYQGNRDTLIKWAETKGDEGLTEYWEEKNSKTIDGKEIPFHGLV